MITITGKNGERNTIKDKNSISNKNKTRNRIRR
jgi:hypothetical protein